MITRQFFIAAASLTLAAGCGTTANAPATTYLAGVHLDAAQFLSAPDSSPEAQRADLAAVKAAQALKDGPRWKLAQDDDKTSPYSAFASVLGADFTKARTPKLAALFDVLFADVKAITGPAKDAFARPRPPLVDPKLEPCEPLESTKSYPSGHATRGWLMALVLADMVPEKANALLARGRDYGDSRVVCAEHFPSDVHAGRLVGAAVFAAARNDSGFERDYKPARAEVRAALALPR